MCCCTPFWNSWLILVFTLLRAQLAWLHSQRLGIKYPFYQLGWKRNFGGCLQILPACVELGVMNGVSDVPPICVHPAQRGSIITLFLAGRTHSQFVPDIILQAEHTLFHHILLWPSDNGAFVWIVIELQYRGGSLLSHGWNIPNLFGVKNIENLYGMGFCLFYNRTLPLVSLLRNKVKSPIKKLLILWYCWGKNTI